MKTARGWALVAVLLAGATGTAAEDLVIESFDTDGTVTFAEVPGVTAYRLDQSTGGSWVSSVGIAASGSGRVTAPVPMSEPSMLYRVVATGTGQAAPGGMALIPGGTNSGVDQDGRPYSLTVESFYMDRHEVTKALWDEVVQWPSGHYYDIGPDTAAGKAPNHPVYMTGIMWMEYMKWCNARSEKEGLAPAYYVRTNWGNLTVLRQYEKYDDSSFSWLYYYLPTAPSYGGSPAGDAQLCLPHRHSPSAPSGR